MHIVHIIGTLGAAGVQRLVLGLKASPPLREHVHSVVCVFGQSGDAAKDFAKAEVPVYDCPFPWPNSLPVPSYTVSKWIRHRLECTFSWRLASLLRRVGANLVHTHVTSRVDLQAHGVLRRAGLPWVWTLHGMYRPEGTELARWSRAVQCARRGRSAITAVSDPLVMDFVARGLGSASEIRVVRAGADVTRFLEPSARKREWRTGLGIAPSAVVFGACGRLVPEKAYDVLIRGLAMLMNEGHDVHAAIAGVGPLGESLRREAADAGLANRFHLLGNQANVRAFLGEVDVFTMPSRSEGFPLALIEAMAAGLPCIGTAVGGVPEILGEGAGIVVPSEDATQLADALRQMLDESRRCEYAIRGRARAPRFSVERTAECFREVYRKLLDARPSGLPG